MSLPVTFTLADGTPINLTGSTVYFTVKQIGDRSAGAIPANLSDSKSNTWTILTEQDNINMGCVMYYCANPTVGSGHTFSTTSHFCGMGIAAFSGASSSPFDFQNGNALNASGNIQPGSITPSANGALVVSAFGSFNGTAPSIPTGYTQIASNTTSVAEAGGMGYKIQTSAAADPTWNSGGSSQCVVIADFLAALPPSVATASFLLNFM